MEAQAERPLWACEARGVLIAALAAGARAGGAVASSVVQVLVDVPPGIGGGDMGRLSDSRPIRTSLEERSGGKVLTGFSSSISARCWRTL